MASTSWRPAKRCAQTVASDTATAMVLFRRSDRRHRAVAISAAMLTMLVGVAR
jgi:hypothetical protein